MGEPRNIVELNRWADEIMAICRSAVCKAQAESRRLGVPNVYTINGLRYYELPNGEYTRTLPNEFTPQQLQPMINILVVYYTDERVSNDSPRGEVTVDEFYDMRADLVDLCRPFGPTGPEDQDLINKSAPPVKFWVAEDQYNDEELYQYVQVYDPPLFTTAWLTGVIKLLGKHTGWGVAVSNLDKAYLLIFADRLLVTGETFANCHDLPAVVQAAVQNLALSAQ